MHTTYTPRHRHPRPNPLTARLAKVDPERLAEYRDNVAAAQLAVVYG